MILLEYGIIAILVAWFVVKITPAIVRMIDRLIKYFWR